MVSPDEAVELMPAASPNGLYGAIWVADDGCVDPHIATHRLADAARELGVAVLTSTRVTGIELGPRRQVQAVLTDRGRIEAEHVVNACGIWAPQVSAMVGAFTPSVPVDQLARVKAMTVEDRTKFFNNWCADRAEATVTHGVYILICKDPSHLAVKITDRAKPAFDKENEEKLIGPLLKAFREKKFDEGIVAAMEFAKSRFAAAKK